MSSEIWFCEKPATLPLLNTNCLIRHQVYSTIRTVSCKDKTKHQAVPLVEALRVHETGSVVNNSLARPVKSLGTNVSFRQHEGSNQS